MRWFGTTYFVDSLSYNKHPDEAEESWISAGLRTHPDKRRTPSAHSFVLRTPPNFTDQCNLLRPDKYYAHAYQARFIFSNTSKSPISRTMAATLKEMYPESYHPRGKDINVRANQHHKPKAPDGRPTPHPNHNVPPFVTPP